MAISKRNTQIDKSELWNIFVAAAFPLHIWAIIIFLRDIPWVAERTNTWDSIGVAGYGMVFSLVESLVIWLVLLIIGSLFLRNWPSNKRASLLCALILVTMIGAVFGQLLSLFELPISTEIETFLIARRNPMWFIYGGMIIIVAPIVLLSAYLAVYSERFQTGLLATLDRITPLMALYLFLDISGLITIIIRNIK